MALGGWASLAQSWRPVVMMRGAQGVLSQVLGKSSAEIYFMAVRPPERRVIKPAIDTLVERWSDAVVGILLIFAFRVLGVGVPVLATVTVVISAVWLVVILGLHRQYLGAIQKALGSRWMEPELVADSVRLPSARAALVQALHDNDERRILLALRLTEYTEHPEVVASIRQCLRHSSPAVRATAVEMMERKCLRDDESLIEGFLHEENEGVRRAAVGYLLTMSRTPTQLVRTLADGEDPALRRYVLDALFDRPHEAPGAIPPQWIDARIEAGTKEDLLLAARAVGTLPGTAPVKAMLRLIQDPDPDVRRAALLSATRRPAQELLDLILPLLLVPEFTYEARYAIAALGDRAVPALTRLLSGEDGGRTPGLATRTQALAARTLAQIGSARAVDALVPLVRSEDRALRHLGFRNLSRVRLQRGEPVVPRALAHRMFVRELREYRDWLVPSRRLMKNALPDIRLLAESYREFADMALERAVRALACWYEPRALFGAFERLRQRNLGAAAPALEYLSHILPASVFRPVSRIFEEKPADAEAEERPEGSDLAGWIRAAWSSGDAWLRACAVHASRHAPSLTARAFALGAEESSVVRAEVEARFNGEGGSRLPGVEARTSPA
jgi:HEAT repeat protein